MTEFVNQLVKEFQRKTGRRPQRHRALYAGIAPVCLSFDLDNLVEPRGILGHVLIWPAEFIQSSYLFIMSIIDPDAEMGFMFNITSEAEDFPDDPIVPCTCGYGGRCSMDIDCEKGWDDKP